MLGEEPISNNAVLVPKTSSTAHDLGILVNRFQWGMVAKHKINPRNFYYDNTLTTAQITALPADEDEKNRLE